VAGDVEFLPGDPAPETHDESRTSSRRWHSRTAALAVVLAALAAWVLTRPGGGPDQPTVVKTVTPSPRATSTAPRAPVTTMTECRFGAPVATEINQAMLRFLPGIRVNNLGAYRCVRGSGSSARIVYEKITGAYRGVVIGVETDLPVRDPVQPVPGLLDDGAGHGAVLARVEAIAAGLHVAVTAYGRERSVAPSEAMRRLADFISLNVVL
jgi:hypothetical protein